MQLITAGNAIIAKTPRSPLIVTRDPRRAKAALVEQGYTAAAADAVAGGYAVLTDPYPARDWMFNKQEVAP
jgi:hypothetical protein